MIPTASKPGIDPSMDWMCGHPTDMGPCEKHYAHVSPGHWVEPRWDDAPSGSQS